MKFWLRCPLREQAGDDGDPGGGGTPPAFDPVKFRTEMLAEFNRGLNGALKNLKAELKATEPTKTDQDPDPDLDGKTDPQVKALQKQLAKLTETLDSEKKSRIETEGRAKEERRQSSLRTELLKHVPAERVDSALRIFGPDVRYAEDGSIVGGADELPLAEFIAAEITKHEYLLPPKQAGGAGATAGNRRGAPSIGIDDIKVGMSAEDTARVRAEIARIAAESGR